MKKYTCAKPWGSHFIKPTIMGNKSGWLNKSVWLQYLPLDRLSKLKFNKGPAVKL